MSQRQDILVIDDEHTVTQAVAKICGTEGMTVATAEHAADALKQLENREFRLMLCDIMMPELNGFQFLEELVRRGIHTPVVMMTGYSTVENAVKSLTSTGAIAYIPKPFTADELLAIVRCSLRCSKLMEEADSAGLERSRAISYVPCPASYYRLGHISWVVMEDEGTARIGVSDLFMKSVEGIREFELATPGDELLQGIPCGQAITLDELQHEIMCPLSGQVIEVNDNARSNPSLVEKDPYFRGWLYRILPTNPKSDLQWLGL